MRAFKAVSLKHGRGPRQHDVLMPNLELCIIGDILVPRKTLFKCTCRYWLVDSTDLASRHKSSSYALHCTENGLPVLGKE